MFGIRRAAKQLRTRAVDALEEAEIMAMLFGGAYEGYQDGVKDQAGASRGFKEAQAMDGLRAMSLRVRAGQAHIGLVRMFWEGRALYRESCFAQVDSANENELIH